MNIPSNSREALIVESLGEVARLLDRVEATSASLDFVRRALADASAGLHGDLKALGEDVQLVMRQAEVELLTRVLQRVDDATTESLAVQSKAMATAAQQAFAAQANPNLERLNKLLQQAIRRIDRPAQTWTIHIANSAVSIAITSCIYSWYMLR